VHVWSARSSVSTLSQFTTYVETASNNQRLDIEHIQAYVVDELQRQNSAANHTKQICEEKLVQLQYQLEDVSLHCVPRKPSPTLSIVT